MKEKALKIVKKEFAGVEDKAGKPYMIHLTTVAKNAKRIARIHGVDTEVVEVAGLLHDLVEDIDHWTVEMVAEEFNETIAAIVDNVTKRKGEKKEDYYNRIKTLKESVVVKAGDTLHNSDVTRFENPTPYNINKSRGYIESHLELLEELQNYL